MKKILMLNYEFPPLGGGASPVSYEIARRLTDTENFDIDVITMGYKKLPQYEKISKNLRLHRVKCWRSKKEICYPWEQLTYLVSAYLKCRKLLQENKYDLCFCHFIIPTGILALELKKEFGLDYIITSHGSDVPGYNTDRFKFLHKFTGSILRKICNNAKIIITPSQFLKKLIINNIDPGVKNKIKYIPNGIEMNKFARKEKKKYILSTGRLLERKGFQYLIKAVSGKDIGYKIHICGDGPMLGELKKLAKVSKTKIIFHGWLNNNFQEYKDLLGQASIYCLMSSKENASISLLEAMSAGCAVITTNVSGCPETIATAGLLVNPKDYLDLNKKILSLINNQKNLLMYQKKAIERIENFFDWKIIIKKYEDLLKTTLEDIKIKR